MGASNKLGKTRKQKIIDMKNFGLSDSEISKALHISKKIVTEIIKDGEKIVKTNNEIKTNSRATRKGGNRNSVISENRKNRSKPNNINENPYSNASNEGSSGNTGTGQEDLIFIGGNKDMVKEDKKNSDAEESYQCGECGQEFKEQLKFCPSCGNELDWENDQE